MEHQVSRSEKKRQAKEIEKLSHELSELSSADLERLPCDEFLKEEIKLVHSLKSGARKRQIKYIAKELRQQPVDEILSFLAEQKGSKLQLNREFKALEKLRDDIMAAAIDEYNSLEEKPDYFTMDRSVSVLEYVAQNFADIDLEAIIRAAENFAVTRKPKQSREVFRLLKAAAEKNKYSQNRGV